MCLLIWILVIYGAVMGEYFFENYSSCVRDMFNIHIWLWTNNYSNAELMMNYTLSMWVLCVIYTIWQMLYITIRRYTRKIDDPYPMAQGATWHIFLVAYVQGRDRNIIMPRISGERLCPFSVEILCLFSFAGSNISRDIIMIVWIFASVSSCWMYAYPLK